MLSMNTANTFLRSVKSSKYNMAFLFKSISCILFLFFTIGFSTIMANISSDVEYLRKQYNAGKNQKDKLIIQYNNKQFQDGDELKKSETQTIPNVQINIETDPENPFLTLIMADPDAPKRGNEQAGPWLHWIQAAFKGNNVNNGKTLADYQGPAPPSGTGPHQYIFLLYKSAHGDTSSAGSSIAVNDSEKRKQFNLKKFETDHQLQLIATTSYTVIG